VVLRPFQVHERRDLSRINGRSQKLPEIVQQRTNRQLRAGLPPHGFQVPAAGVGLIGHAQSSRVGQFGRTAQAGRCVVPFGP